MTKEFKNSNGRVYNIIKQNGDYAFLQDIESLQIVVAWLLQENSWGQGYYFDIEEVKKAKDFYNKKVGFKAITK